MHSAHISMQSATWSHGQLTFLWQVFHHYMGAPLALYWINSKGELHKAILGKDLEKGQRPQVVMPAEVWFAQRIEEGEKGDFCLTGVTVSPGWDLADMDFASTEELV